ncbi:MAG: hypothetical protein KF782_21225 [Labilithrix sp.]|nr:hypothetical protein [Labilithrix sp.]
MELFVGGSNEPAGTLTAACPSSAGTSLGNRAVWVFAAHAAASELAFRTTTEQASRSPPNDHVGRLALDRRDVPTLGYDFPATEPVLCFCFCVNLGCVNL